MSAINADELTRMVGGSFSPVAPNEGALKSLNHVQKLYAPGTPEYKALQAVAEDEAFYYARAAVMLQGEGVAAQRMRLILGRGHLAVGKLAKLLKEKADEKQLLEDLSEGVDEVLVKRKENNPGLFQ